MKFRDLTRREIFLMLQALSSIPLFNACKQFSSGHSDTKDLTNFTSLTSFNPKRVEAVKQKFGIDSWNNYASGMGNGRQDVFDNLSVVPDVYLGFLQKRAKSVGFNITAGGQAAGMCWFDQVGALKITLNSPIFATIHEVGHGVESFAYRLQKIPDGDSLRERTYSQVTSSSEAYGIGDYAKSNSKELFADGFSSFYRSPKSRADLSKMPLTWKWLKSVLVCPVNLGSSENADDFIASASELATKSSSKSGSSPSESESNSAADIAGPTEEASVPKKKSSGAADPCATPEDQITEFVCQLSKMLGGSGAGLALLEEARMILPKENQFLTAFDRFLVMVALGVTDKEASQIKVYLDKELLATGLEKDRFAGKAGLFSTMIKIPESMTPKDIYQFASRKLTLVLGSKTLLSTSVRISRFSLCGDIKDFKS